MPTYLVYTYEHYLSPWTIQGMPPLRDHLLEQCKAHGTLSQDALLLREMRRN